MQECAHKTELCQCISWEGENLVLGVNHLMYHFVFERFELEYSTLEQLKDCRLCKVGCCSICGKRLCIGSFLPSQNEVDKCLREIYQWVFQMWKGPHGPLPEEATCFRDMFLSLFHEVDRDAVSDWLDQCGRGGK